MNIFLPIVIGITGLIGMVCGVTTAMHKSHFFCFDSGRIEAARGSVSEISEGANLLIPIEKATAAPTLGKGAWINSSPLTIDGLKGKVVLVDFWTFACVNCRNTLPALKRWDTLYREKGLTIVGIHSPELEIERSIVNVTNEVQSLGITYPVLTDNDYNTWNAYGVNAWPTQFLVDKHGRIRWSHVGEGGYEEAEVAIRLLLREN